MAHPRHKQGFTIIEVVLVLAIAGLIFLAVFVALPALQRAQRDTERRNMVSTVFAALEQYKARNHGLSSLYNPLQYSGSSGHRTLNLDANGKISHTSSGSQGVWEKFYEHYLSDEGDFRDPDGSTYGLVFYRCNVGAKECQQDDMGSGLWEFGSHYIVVTFGSKCKEGYYQGGDPNQNKPFSPASGPNNYSVYYALENGTYCKDDS